MKRFHLTQFLALSNMLRKSLALAPDRAKEPMGDDMRRVALLVFPGVQADCKALAFTGSSAAAGRIIALLNDPNALYGEFNTLVDDFLSRSADEMAETHFMALSPVEAEEYCEPWKGWEGDVLKSFPGSSGDVIEARRCLALGRYTASIFHLMRVMETGLRSVGASLRDESLDPRKNPTWERILKRGDAELRKPLQERSPEWKEHESFFATAIANLRAVKDAWRNSTLHVGRIYSEEEAREVYSAVRGFMRHIATKLSEIEEITPLADPAPPTASGQAPPS